MFRRLVTGLPQDPRFPTDLGSLGLFINEKNQIRRIDSPDKGFQMHITNDERTNESHHEAFYVAVRKEIRSRLREIGIGRLYLPQLVGKKPHAPHIPIIATPAKVLRAKKRLMVVVNDEHQDLGLLSFRALEREAGIEVGSVLALARELAETSQQNGTKAKETSEGSIKNGDCSATPGLLVLNPGQSLYSYSLNEAMSRRSWYARPVESAVHPSILVDTENYVTGNKTPDEHVAFVFDKVIDNARFVHPDAEIYIIGLQARGDLVLSYLNQNWSRWAHRVKAVALTEPRHSSRAITNGGFRKFLSERSRAWSASNAPTGTPLAVPINMSSGHSSFRDPDIRDHDALLDPSRQNTIVQHDVETTRAHHHIDWCAEIQSSDDQSTPDELSAALARQSIDAIPHATPNLDWPNMHPGDNEVFTVTQPIFSAGDFIFGEEILPAVYKSVIRWFEDVAREPGSYKNPLTPLTALWRDEEPSGSEGNDENEHNTVTDGDQVTQVENIAKEEEYGSGEADAVAEHGGFVTKDNEEQAEERMHGPA